MNAPHDPINDPAIRLAVETFCGSTQGLCSTIDRRDEMFLYNRDLLYRNETCAAETPFAVGTLRPFLER